MDLKFIESNPNLLGRLNATGRKSFYRDGYYGEDIIVALLDNGVKAHTEFGDNLIESTEVDGFHGTACASLIAGLNVGIAPKAKILPIKLPFNHTLIDVAAALRKVLAWQKTTGRKVDIVSLSVSGSGNFAELHSVVKECWANDILIVCSSGNTAQNDIRFPGAYPETLCVGSVDNLRIYSKFESFGQMLDVVQYGEKIITLDVINGGYTMQTGTSFSTPMVAGIAALLICKYKKVMKKNPSVAFIKEYLMTSVVDLGIIGEDDFYGKGFCTLDYQEPKNLEVWIDRGYMLVNGATVMLDQAAEIDPDTSRTLLPVRAICEAVDATVGWDPIERKITIQR